MTNLKVTLDINLEDELEDMSVSEWWDILQYLWNKLEDCSCAGNEDWDSFCEENNIRRR